MTAGKLELQSVSISAGASQTESAIPAPRTLSRTGSHLNRELLAISPPALSMDILSLYYFAHPSVYPLSGLDPGSTDALTNRSVDKLKHQILPLDTDGLGASVSFRNLSSSILYEIQNSFMSRASSVTNCLFCSPSLSAMRGASAAANIVGIALYN